jgi:predicted acetyltransferase
LPRICVTQEIRERPAIVTTVRPLANEEIAPFARIAANAYPAMRLATEDDLRMFEERLRARMDPPTDALYGAFRDGALVGGMRLIDFRMNVRGVTLPTGGVGMVAVDLLHKKEKVARDLIVAFLDWCGERTAPFAALYPFRPDFYKRMGFGFGTKSSQYRLRPDAFPALGDRGGLRFLGSADKEAIGASYARIQRRTHGMMEKLPRELDRYLEGGDARVIGYELDGALSGYMAFGFETDPKGNFVVNNLRVRELIYETREALAALLAFIHSQADQIARVIVETQDEALHHLFADPRDDSGLLFPHVYHQTNTQGVGIMYRVVDTCAAWEALAGVDFGGATYKLRLHAHDSFRSANDQPVTMAFADGKPRVVEEDQHDVALSMDIAEFSALLMGAVDLQSLYLYGLAEISDPAWLPRLTQLFATPRKPICVTPF